MIKTNMFIVILLTAISSHGLAQLEDGEFHYGFSVGGTMSKISDISTTLIRPIFPVETYNTTENYRLGFSAGFLIYYRFDNSKLAIQPELSYAMYGGDFDYDDIEGLEYTIAFKYQYFNLATLVKINPVGGLFVGIGPQVGVNISSSNLSYESNMPDLGPDLQIQHSLREVLKGKTDFSILGALGYEFEMGLILEARYKLGLVDVIETQSNGFYFIENKNLLRGFQFNIGYAIPFYN